MSSPASPQPKPHQRQPIYLVLAIIIGVLGLAIPAAWQNYVASLGTLDLNVLGEGSTVVLDREGRLLRAFTTTDGRWRLPIAAKDVDPRFLKMLMAYEDRHFWRHHGVDYLALVRGAGQLLLRGHVVSGGSTLTMQVARLLEPRAERSLPAKLRQIVRASQIEAEIDKAGILDRYLALAPYGGNIEGLRAASIAYFGKEPKHLSIGEAALLVALPQAPETRRPDRFPDAARQARNRVIDRALQRHVINQMEADAARAEPVPRERRPFPMLAPHATESVLTTDPGLRVHHLTLDGRLQATLEVLAREAAQRLGPKITAAIMVIDNATGEVRAHVGASDYFSIERSGAIDMTQALRSPGSALKPFIYALAFENGIAHPETLVDDRPAHYGVYAPEDFDRQFQGTVTARRALQMSLNVPAIELLSEVGPERFLSRLRGAGAIVELPKEARDQPPGLAVGLGGLGIRLVDIAKLFSGLARRGSVPDLVEDLDLPRVAPLDRRVTEPIAAWYVTDILKGAPPPLNAVGGRIAFKTGTSYGYRDAFAIGYDKRITLAVWVGRADNASVPGLIGRQAAAPILFDAFARYGGEPETITPPHNVIYATTGTLPPPLRHLRKDAPKTIAATATAELKIAYPPNGARVDLGLSKGPAPTDDPPSLALKAEGGVLPLTWLVNGLPVSQDDIRRETSWRPDGAGFARVSVVDAKGATDTVTVRLE
jgi:penicillin-binding protein 1C